MKILRPAAVRFAAIAALAVVAGCPEEQPEPTDDVQRDDAQSVDVQADAPRPTPDVPGDAVAFESADATAGELGAPCFDSSDCASGYCIAGPDGLLCTQTCLESCPDG